MIREKAIETVAYAVRMATWVQITPEQVASQIIEALNPTIWPRRSLGYGTTGTSRTRKATK